MSLLLRVLQQTLAGVTIGLLLLLAVIVITNVIARYVFNASFIWYDEVASVLLAWITFYGAAFAACGRRHLGFESVLLALPRTVRLLAFGAGEIVVYLVFASLGYAGWFILDILGSETLVSLRWVPLWFTQSVVPIGCGLFLLAQLLSTPTTLRRVLSGVSAEEEEIAEEIARNRPDGQTPA